VKATTTLPGDAPAAPGFAPGFALGFVPDSFFPNEIKLVCTRTTGATRYNLYASVGGAPYAKVDEVNTGAAREANAFNEFVVVFSRTIACATNFRITAQNANGESAPSPVITADPSKLDVGGVQSVNPVSGQTGVSVTPTLAWGAKAGAVCYMVAIDANPGEDAQHGVYLAIVTSAVTQIPFGQVSGNGVLLGGAEVSSLSPGTTYRFLVRAFDTTNWAFASNSDQDFMTAP